MSKPSLTALIALAILLHCGCAGRPAHPVMVYQHGDETRSCDALQRELQLIEEDRVTGVEGIPAPSKLLGEGQELAD